MMEPSSDPGMFWLNMAMLIVGNIILFYVGRWYVRWKAGVAGSKMTMEEARDEFARLMGERLRASMRSAELDALIVRRWNEWPIEYKPALYECLRHAQLLEESLYAEAAEKGIYTRRILDGPILAPQYTPAVPQHLPISPPQPSYQSTIRQAVKRDLESAPRRRRDTDRPDTIAGSSDGPEDLDWVAGQLIGKGR